MVHSKVRTVLADKVAIQRGWLAISPNLKLSGRSRQTVIRRGPVRALHYVVPLLVTYLAVAQILIAVGQHGSENSMRRRKQRGGLQRAGGGRRGRRYLLQSGHASDASESLLLTRGPG